MTLTHIPQTLADLKVGDCFRPTSSGSDQRTLPVFLVTSLAGPRKLYARLAEDPDAHPSSFYIDAHRPQHVKWLSGYAAETPVPMTVTAVAQNPYITWADCYADHDTQAGCVVQLPHTADRFNLGLAVQHTQPGQLRDWWPGEATITPAWGRLLTGAELWAHERQVRGQPITDGPPPRWHPQDDTPGWAHCTPDEGEQIWLVQDADGSPS